MDGFLFNLNPFTKKIDTKPLHCVAMNKVKVDFFLPCVASLVLGILIETGPCVLDD